VSRLQGLDNALQSAEAAGPRLIIIEAGNEALTLMEKMCGNEGQLVTYQKHVEKQFFAEVVRMAKGTDYEWEDFDAGDPYMNYMGEIIEEGNTIMRTAGEEATALEDQLEAAQAALFVITGGKVGSFSDIIQDIFD
jgi:flavin-dependent dehydrogenase